LKKLINNITEEKLIAFARAALKNSYAPYTGYISGAALLGDNGVVYTGCYVENKDPTACVCAECAAVAKAVSRGCTHFSAIATANGRGGMAIPCAICRKVLSEFHRDLPVIMEDESGNPIKLPLYELLPGTFCIKI
jgi:cytidine deaminase